MLKRWAWSLIRRLCPYDELLEIFWEMHDPTRADGQGDYTGSQYRSVIFWHTDEQKAAALASRDRLAASGKYGSSPILTEILPGIGILAGRGIPPAVL